jgi:hypothetical protein
MKTIKQKRAKPDTALSILKRIDNVLKCGDVEGGRLWAVLTALRGPDVETYTDEKSRTTARIRTAAFPKTYHSGNTPALFCEGPIDEVMPYRKLAENDHFVHHVRVAAKVLRELKRIP